MYFLVLIVTVLGIEPVYYALQPSYKVTYLY